MPEPADQPVLARAREDAHHVLARAQRRDGEGGIGRGRGHVPIMYREPDAAPDLGPTARRPARPRARLRVHGLERRGRRRVGGAAASIGSSLRRDALRARRSRGLLRLPGAAADRRDHRGPHARDHLAGDRDLRGARAARTARPRAAAGPGAVVPLAHVLRSRRRARRGARDADGRDARRAAGRRPAHAPGRRSPAWRPTRASSSGLGLARPTTRARPGSSACCRPPARRPGYRRASLWASVPHYVAAAPNPKAALALVRKLEALLGVAVDATELESASVEYERQVSLAVQSDPDVQAFVERLEQAAAEEEAADDVDPTNLPSGDVLAREFQRFLRQRGPDDAQLAGARRSRAQRARTHGAADRCRARSRSASSRSARTMCGSRQLRLGVPSRRPRGRAG